MKALVTGGAGFIGSHIVDRLLEDGHSVVVIDNFSTGHRSNLPDNQDKLEVVECDIRDFEALSKHMKNVDWVFHLAAIASVPKTVSDPVGSQAVNYLGTLHVLEAARVNKAKRVVFASSAAVYGDDPVLPKTEAMMPLTKSPYAVDKLASEYACSMYSDLYGVETVCLRYFNIYGPRQDPASPYSGVISIFGKNIDDDVISTIYGDGEQTRDFVFVSDVVEANIKAITLESAVGEVFNIGTSKPVSLNNLLKQFYSLKNKDFEVKYKEARDGDIKHSYANVEKANQALSWKAKVSLNDGLSTLM